MSDLDVVLPTATVMGFVAAFLRVGAFFVAIPFLGRRLQVVGRVALSIALALVLAEPIAPPNLAGLVTIVATNVAIGLLTGFVVSIPFNAFLGAGAVTDTMAGLGIGAQFDPLTGATASVYDRFFDLTAVAIFLVVGGDRLLVSGLAATTEVLPLDGAMEIAPGLQDVMIEQVSVLLVAVVQIAAPALVALLATEIVMGLAARLMPQVNLFVVGLPARLVVGLLAAMTIVVTLPTMVEWFMDGAEDTFRILLSGVRSG